MVDPDGPAPFEDVNQAVRDEWKAETTPYERVRDVIGRIYVPTAAATVAEHACTSPKTARKHLNTLADEGVVTTETGAHDGTLYRRSPESLVVEQAADMLSEVSTEELREGISEMQDRLSEFRAEYGVESPEVFAVERTNELLGEGGEVEPPDEETIREWKTTRRNLAFANAALSIANAQKFVEPEAQVDNERRSSP